MELLQVEGSLSLFTVNRQYINILPDASPRSDNEPPGPFEEMLRLLPLGGILIAVQYGLTWLWATRFLARFGVSPEEVGITPAWALFRLPYEAAPPIIALVLVWAIIEAKTRLSTQWYTAIRAISLLIALVFLIIVARGPYYGVYGIYQGTVALQIIAFTAMSASIVAWTPKRPAAALLIAVAAGLLFLGASISSIWQSATIGSNVIAAGGTGSFSDVFRLLPVFRLDPVEVHELSGDDAPSPLERFQGCGTLFGSANGATVVLVTEKERGPVIWRLATDQIALRSC